MAGCKNSEIPDDGSVVEIGEYAFAKRMDMTGIIIPSCIEKVYATSFEGCDKLAVCCIATEKPEAWEDFWTGNVKKVVWGYDSFA